MRDLKSSGWKAALAALGIALAGAGGGAPLASTSPLEGTIAAEPYFREDGDPNPCRGLAGEEPRALFKRAILGEVAKESLAERITGDILAVQGGCGSAVFEPAGSSPRPDGSAAFVFRTRPGTADSPVAVGYFPSGGRLVRISIWCPDAAAESHFYPSFDRLLRGEGPVPERE